MISKVGSLRRIQVVTQKEIRHILRDPQTLAIILIMPVMMMFLYGYALNSDVKDLSIAVEDADQSTASRELVRRLDASTFMQVQAVYPILDDPRETFRVTRVRAILRIPAGFGKGLRRSSGSQLQLLIDGSDPNIGTLLRNSADGLLQNAVMRHLDMDLPSVLDIRTSVRYNPEQKSAYFFVPGLMAVILLMISALLTSIAITREKENGTLVQMLISPIRPKEILLGKLLPYVVLAGLAAILILSVGRWVFGVAIQGSIAVLAWGSLAYILTGLSIGLLISTLAKRQHHAMIFALSTTLMPTVILTGFIFPVASMPLPLRSLSNILPGTWYLQLVRGVILKGVGLSVVWPSIAVLLAEAFVFTGIALAKFKVKQ
jgi:ABC-2 type transport system permease protein